MQSRLLIVEDDGLIRLDLVDMVSDLGFLAEEAATADQAVEMLETEDRIDAILTDIDMPGSINGLGLANVAHRRWPISRSSLFPADTIRRRGLATGCDFSHEAGLARPHRKGTSRRRHSLPLTIRRCLK